ECNLRCVDLAKDSSNCGSCGNVCPVNQFCFRGACSTEGEIITVDAGMDGGGASANDAASGREGAAEDGAKNDGASGDGAGPDGNACAPPFDSPEHCGDCDTRCADPTPVCGLEGTYKCLAACEPPLEACGPKCIDKFSDENNCGMCGNVCPSGICQAGKCVG